MIPKLKYSLRKTIFSTKRIEQSECNNWRISPKKGGEQRTEKIEENFDTQGKFDQIINELSIETYLIETVTYFVIVIQNLSINQEFMQKIV